MTIIEEHQIAAQDLDKSAFLPYGEVIKARSGMQNQFASNPYDPETSTEEAQLVLCNGQPRLWIMHLHNRGFAFTKLARHKKVSQCLGALQGKEWFIGVAPPQGENECPSLKDVAVFRVPGDCVIKLHVSTWHAGPHFSDDEALFFNLENMNTNKKDFESVDLATKCVMLT